MHLGDFDKYLNRYMLVKKLQYPAYFVCDAMRLGDTEHDKWFYTCKDIIVLLGNKSMHTWNIFQGKIHIPHSLAIICHRGRFLK